MAQYYVSAETAKGKKVVAYSVMDCIAGIESEHDRFEVGADRSVEAARRKAEERCAELNKEAK